MAKTAAAKVRRTKGDHAGASAVHGEQKHMHGAAAKSASRLSLGSNMVQGKGADGTKGDAAMHGNISKIMRQGSIKARTSPAGKLRQIMSQ